MNTARVQLFKEYEDAAQVVRTLRARGYSNATALYARGELPPAGWMVRYNAKGRREFYPERERACEAS